MLAYQGKDGVLGQRLSLEALYGDLKNSTKKLMYVFLELEFVSSLGGILLDQFKILFFFLYLCFWLQNLRLTETDIFHIFSSVIYFN